MNQPANNRDLLAAVQLWVAANYPGERARDVQILLEGRERPVSLPMPLALQHAAEGAVPAFEPTAFQLGILDALAGKALRVDALVAVVKDRPRLYRDPGGIKELQRHGLVEYDRRAGYYRPDAPPEAMEE